MVNETEKTKIVFEKNCFDLIRYWAAFSVMFLHYTGYALMLSNDGITILQLLRQVFSFFPGVVVLFAISGYLIAASFEKSKSLREFFVKRVVRLYPELWVCTLVNLLVVFALTRKLLDKSIGIWLVTQIFGVANTPSCLKNFATGSVNGALWTIFTEIQLYIVLGMTYKFLKKLSIKKWLVLLSAFAAINVLAGFTVKFAAAKIIERIFLPYAIWFFIGTFCYVYKEKMLPFLTKCFFPLTACYTVLRLLPISIPGYYADIAVGILCPLIVIGGVTYCRRFV